MPRLIRSNESEVDVFEIARYIAADNADAAFNLIDTFETALRMLAENPLAGRPRPELVPCAASLSANISFSTGLYQTELSWPASCTARATSDEKCSANE
jgi:plasmid stabilization system protein ParE